MYINKCYYSNKYQVFKLKMMICYFDILYQMFHFYFID